MKQMMSLISTLIKIFFTGIGALPQGGNQSRDCLHDPLDGASEKVFVFNFQND